MPPLLSIGAYETKTHLADLLPAGAGQRRASLTAALQMQRFMAEAPASEPCDIESLLNDGRD